MLPPAVREGVRARPAGVDAKVSQGVAHTSNMVALPSPTRLHSSGPHGGVSFAEFSDLVADLSRWARRRKLRMPGVQSPPRVEGVERVVRRFGGEVRTIAVMVRGRRRGDVLADVVAGILLANGVARQDWAAFINDARASVDIGPAGPRFLDAA